MRRLYDFQCDNGHVNEFLRSSDVEEVDCPDCELKARKIVTPVKDTARYELFRGQRKMG